MSATLSGPERAWALFASPLQESARPTPQEIRAAVEAAPPGECLARVAQEAGDHPEIYLLRMRWALHAVAAAYEAETAAG